MQFGLTAKETHKPRGITQCYLPPDRGSAGLIPTEARGNYLHEAPYLRETKTYLNYMHASEYVLGFLNMTLLQISCWV